MPFELFQFIKAFISADDVKIGAYISLAVDALSMVPNFHKGILDKLFRMLFIFHNMERQCIYLRRVKIVQSLEGQLAALTKLA